MRIVAIVQARMGSTRLPGKVLMDICGQTMLARVVNRIRKAALVDDVVVATSVRMNDDAIVAECQHLAACVFRGDEEDVLDRYYQAAKHYHADAVVRITADCPLIEPEIIDVVAQAFLDRQPQLDYSANIIDEIGGIGITRTFPRGLDTEVMRFDALESAWRDDDDPIWREHVTPYIFGNPELFNTHCVTNDKDYSSIRWTVDALEDLTLVRRIYECFGHDGFSWREVLNLLAQHPYWLEINRTVGQKKN